MKSVKLQNLKRWGLVLLCWLVAIWVYAADTHRTSNPPLDSLLKHLFDKAEYNERVVRHFESDLYTKGRVHRHRSNLLIRSVPQINSFESGVDEYIGETYNQLNYTAPYIYDRKVVAVYGSFPDMHKESNMVMEFFNLSIYKETMVDDHFLSPFVQKNKRFYRYQLDSIQGSKAYISYQPKHYNTQLLAGNFVLNMPDGTVGKATFQGEYDFLKFTLQVQMGKTTAAIYLPEQFELDFEFNYVWNKYSGHYLVAQHYNKIETYHKKQANKKVPLNLTDRFFSLSTDTTAYQQDSLLIAAYRFFPLKMSEQQLYNQHALRMDSLRKHEVPTSKSRTFWNRLGEAMVADYGLNVPKLGTLEMSPILHPVMFQYSKTNGYTYRMDLGYTFRNNRGTYFRVAPYVGYNFKFKKIYWRMMGTYRYWPQKSAEVEVEMANGRQVSSGRVLEEIKSNHPLYSDQELDKLHLDFFNDRYLRVNHRMELVNGLDLTVGLNIHSKQPTRLPDVQIDDPDVKDHYTTFAPRVRIDYTPVQYYYWDRGIKKKVYSPYPTFSLDYEMGLDGVLGSNSRYQRWEFEMDFKWKLDIFNQISYRIGTGLFNKQKKTFFVDYINFQHSHLPEGWSDELAGTFQLLAGEHYDNTERYVRGHVVYESPMLAITRLNGLAHYIKAERLYLSGLWTPQLHPYLEVGYGFTTHVIDLGFYANMMNGKLEQVGMKWAFELFRR